MIDPLEQEQNRQDVDPMGNNADILPFPSDLSKNVNQVIGGDNESSETPPDNALSFEQKVTHKEATQIADQAAKSGDAVEIAGRKLSDPKQAFKNFEDALEIIKAKTGLTVDLNNLSFKKLDGDASAQSVGKDIHLDTIALMHSVMRLAHIISHELSHGEGKIDMESLAEFYAQEVWGFKGDGEIPEVYDAEMEIFAEFIKRLDPNHKVQTKNIETVYELYYSSQYEKIYDLYENRYIDSLKTEKEKDEAFNFFSKAFPLLSWSETGSFAPKEYRAPEVAEDISQIQEETSEETQAAA